MGHPKNIQKRPIMIIKGELEKEEQFIDMVSGNGMATIHIPSEGGEIEITIISFDKENNLQITKI